MAGFENLKKQLALAVRCYQWSYAIFWSISVTQPSVLEWGSGYYNGDIKTRKTTQSEELNADLINSQRSDQLRELYESLAAGESNSQARRPSAALSPEDLTDTEWYYLVCMSFVFQIGQGLPGKTFDVGHPIWVCNAHVADGKAFSRSLLAKSASIQTVACFPFFGGVVEMGATELLLEDMNLIERIKASFLDILPQPDISFPNAMINSDMELPGMELDHDYLDANLVPIEECDELDSLSPEDSASKVVTGQVDDDSFMITGGASQVQSWHFLDEDFSNCVPNSFNSSDCISQTLERSAKERRELKIENLNHYHISCPTERIKLQSPNARSDDLHYQSVVSTLLKSSDQLGLGTPFGCSRKGSSFVKWKQVGLGGSSGPRNAMSQLMLKKVLSECGRRHVRYDVPKTDPEEIETQHLPLITGQQELLNERFAALQSLVPSHNKVDKAKILDATINYLKELEERVQQLESFKESTDLQDTSMPKKTQDTVERTSDNYKTSSKRKASHMDQIEQMQTTSKTSKDGSSDKIFVSIVDNKVMIELRCCWRECLLLKVMDAMNSLSLDSHSIQSSTADGILQLTIKSEFQGSRVPSVEMIRQKLRRIIVQST